MNVLDRKYFSPRRRGRCALLMLSLVVLFFGEGTTSADTPRELTVAISLDIPPYVMRKATTGIEVDIVQEALPSYTLRFTQMPYADLQTAVPRKKVDVAVCVEKFKGDGVFYSNEFVSFVNAAITKKNADMKINSVADLASHKVLAWEDAYLELGPEFKKLFSPKSPERKNYVEIANQANQVKSFWQAKSDVIVIDRSIFSYFSVESGHSMDTVVFHPIFPQATSFRAGFQDTALRDAFNAGLARLCQHGDYAKILKQYHVELPRTVCGD